MGMSAVPDDNGSNQQKHGGKERKHYARAKKLVKPEAEGQDRDDAEQQCKDQYKALDDWAQEDVGVSLRRASKFAAGPNGNVD